MNPKSENPLEEILDEIEAETHVDKKQSLKADEVLDVRGRIIKLNEEWGGRSDEYGEDSGRIGPFLLSEILPPEK